MKVDGFVVVWSPRQDALQVDSVADMLRRNAEAVALALPEDYVVLSFAATREEAATQFDDWDAVREHRKLKSRS